jgi:hypothetical protein
MNLTFVTARSILRKLEELQERLLFSNGARLKDDNCEYLAFIFYVLC